MKKKRVFIFATCHASRILKVLNQSPAFARQFDVEMQYNFSSPGKPLSAMDFLEKISESDLFLYHKTTSLAQQIPGILLQEKSIAIPYVTNKLFWPSYDIPGSNGLLVQPGFEWGAIPWRCKYIEMLYKSGLPKAKIITRYMRADFAIEYDLEAMRNAQISYFRTLDDPGKLAISDWLIENFMQEKLFYIYNHPTKAVFFEIGRKVLKLIGIENDLTKEDEDPFDVLDSPIHPSVAKALSLRFYNPDQIYKIGMQKVGLRGYLELYIDALAGSREDAPQSTKSRFGGLFGALHRWFG